MTLQSQAELLKLARELQVDQESLAPLAAVPPDDLRALRRLVGDALYDSHRSAFERAAAATGLLPAALNARLAQTLIGPYLAARIAAATPTDRAVKMARHLDVPFLADVCLSLDPTRVAGTVRGLPDQQVVAVGMELLSRGEHVTLGKFVDLVSDDVLDQMADAITDPEALLEIAVSVEAYDQLDALMARLDDRRLGAMVQAAADSGQMAATVILITHLGEANRRRLAAVVLDTGPETFDDVIATADAEQAWPEILPVIAALDTEHLAALARRGDLLTAARLRRLITAVLPHAELWGVVVDTLGRLPVDVQHEVAERLQTDDDFDVPGLLGLLRMVPGASDLPLAVALSEHTDT